MSIERLKKAGAVYVDTVGWKLGAYTIKPQLVESSMTWSVTVTGPDIKTRVGFGREFDDAVANTISARMPCGVDVGKFIGC